MPKSINRRLDGLGTHHVSLLTLDLQASLAFYRDVMGMEVVATFGTERRPIHLLDIGDGTHLELFAPTPGVPAPGPQEAPYRHVALAVDDVRGAVERVRAAGRPITVEPKDVVLAGRPTTLAFFQGPGGESVEFFHQDAV
jgi:catechol 2,3-dioxygenase-like lactoylglutathione lyase family enzyme